MLDWDTKSGKLYDNHTERYDEVVNTDKYLKKPKTR